jgi:hypothetical protein
VVSALIVVIAGFWMVIPVFGRRKPGACLPGRSITERFLAEWRFLKKFRALETYLAAYIQEIRIRQGVLEEAFRPELSASLLASRCGLPEREVRNALLPGKNIKFREFLRYRKILETILEKL